LSLYSLFENGWKLRDSLVFHIYLHVLVMALGIVETTSIPLLISLIYLMSLYLLCKDVLLDIEGSKMHMDGEKHSIQ
jgi:hypothetical protein